MLAIMHATAAKGHKSNRFILIVLLIHCNDFSIRLNKRFYFLFINYLLTNKINKIKNVKEKSVYNNGERGYRV